MIHLYCGDGKGKTTAAMGLALRMAGRGRKVVVAQFLKGADSGERCALARLPQVILLPVPGQVKFSFAMTEKEKQAERVRYTGMLQDILRLCAGPGLGLLVLDEACAGINTGLVALDQVLSCLDLCREQDIEAVLTGRDPHPALLERADYITQFTKQRHPYDQGVSARPGVEF